MLLSAKLFTSEHHYNITSDYMVRQHYEQTNE